MNYLHNNPNQDSKVIDENEDSHLGRHLLRVLKKHENDINQVIYIYFFYNKSIGFFWESTNFQIELVSGATETHGSVRLRSIRMAEALKNSGIKKGDVILLCAENHNDICIPYIASLYIGAVPLGLTTNMKHSKDFFRILILFFLMKFISFIFSVEILHVLSMGKPKMVFSDPVAVPAIEKVLVELELDAEIVTFGNVIVDGKKSFSDFVKCTNTEESFV